METVKLNFCGDMAFDAHIGDFLIKLDAEPQHGGANLGPKPKPLMLAALAGCTGMDVASLAKKMRVQILALEIEADATKSEQMPIVYTSLKLIYRFTADQNDAEKIKKIVDMSQERYCGVAAMMRSVAPLSYDIYLNDKLL